MKNILRFGLPILAFIILISSCSTSNDVASNRLIQKRKFNKGYHVDFHSKIFNKHKQSSNSNESITKTNDVETYNDIEYLEINSENQDIVSIKNESKPNNLEIIKTKQTPTFKPVETKQNLTEINLSQPIINQEFSVKNKLQKVKKLIELKKTNSADDMLILLLILCFLIPFVAVGIKTDWDVKKVLISVLLSFLFWVPGVIYAILVVTDNI